LALDLQANWRFRDAVADAMVMLMDERQILDVGESAPEFELADSTGVVRRLSEIVAGGLGVVIFYRGHW
jgi:hypothetical protein